MARRLSSICSFALLRLWILATLTGFSTKNVLPHVFIQVHKNQRFPRHLVQRHASAPGPPSPDAITGLLGSMVTQKDGQMREQLAKAVSAVLKAHPKTTTPEAQKQVAEAEARKQVAEAEAQKQVAEAQRQKKMVENERDIAEDNLLAVKGELTARHMLERFAAKVRGEENRSADEPTTATLRTLQQYRISKTAQTMQSIVANCFKIDASRSSSMLVDLYRALSMHRGRGRASCSAQN
ncbi:uxuA [Symbiodinium sp. CCMP2592]|nr:uxuA [Symbiodinium sp. CCMP2592]